MIGTTIVSTVLLLLTMAPAAAAQWSLDLYAGANFTHQTDVRGIVWSSAPRDREFGHFLHGTIDDAEFGPGPGAGVRGWYRIFAWLELGLDAGWFRTAPHMHFTSLHTRQDGVVPIRVNDTDLTIDAFTLSPQARIVFPSIWRVVPRISLGPLLAMTRASTDEPDHVTRDASSLDVGLQANVGAELDLSKTWSLFIEYRFTHVAPSYDFGGPAGRDVSLDLDTSAAIFGVTRRWK